jgi:hypothetical protein
MAMSAERHRALEILAGSSLGCTEATLLAHGFTTDLLVDLVQEGLATATPERCRTAAAGTSAPRCSYSRASGGITHLWGSSRSLAASISKYR